jgi:hypothetical protein
MDSPDRYWFRAKCYGWGWGPPTSWQGWLVLLLWLGALIGGQLLMRLPSPWVWGFRAAMVGVLLLVCYKKGEPPRWRWGDRE